MRRATIPGALVVCLSLLTSAGAASGPVEPQAAAVAPLTWDALANAEYLVQLGETGSDQKIRLVDGKYEEKTGPGATEIVTVDLERVYALGDLNGDGAGDAAIVLAYNTGGTGVFHDLDAMLNEGGKAIQAATTPLEDRIILRTLAVVRGKIELDMVHAGPSEPACCPTEEVFRTYGLTGSKLVQLSDVRVDKTNPRLPFPAWSVLANMEYSSTLVAGGVVKLTDGTYEENQAGSETKTIRLGSGYATGDLTGGGLPDAAVLLVANPYQANEIDELAVVLSENGKAIYAGAAPLGAGSKVRGLAIVSGQVVVDVLTPAGKRVQRYVVRDGRLIPASPADTPKKKP